MGSLKKRGKDERAPGRLRRISGIDRIVHVGEGLVAVIFFIEERGGRRVLDGPDDEAVLVPISAVPDAIGKAMMAIGRRITARQDGITVRH